MSDQSELATEEEKLLAPLHLDLEVTINGVKTLSRCFVRQSDWESMDGEARKQQIRSGLQGMADAVIDQIDRAGLISS